MIDRRTTLSALTAFTFSMVGIIKSSAFAEEAVIPEVLATRLLKSVSPLGERTIGVDNASVNMVVYGSTTCEHSAEFSQNVWPQLRNKYVAAGKLRFIFRELPLDNLALATFVLVRSLPEDQYFPMLEVLWKQQKVWRTRAPKNELLQIMKMAGMTIEKYESTLQNKDAMLAVYNAGKSAQAEYGIKKTPTIFINGRLVATHEEASEFVTIIDSELAA